MQLPNLIIHFYQIYKDYYVEIKCQLDATDDI